MMRRNLVTGEREPDTMPNVAFRYVIDGYVLSARSSEALQACVEDWLSYRGIRKAA